MFIGRGQELHTLQELYVQSGFGMVVIQGRRRIGKSTLIAEFVKDKRTVFYTATKVGAGRNLELFSSQVIATLDPDHPEVIFRSTEAVFDYIGKKTGNEKIVLVIDELPYWAEEDASLLSVLQKYIDTDWKRKNILLILCGSSLSFMEKKVLSEKSPLFGRRNAQIRLDAFHYRDAAEFVPNYTLEEKAICYGITGGVAKYLSMLDDRLTLDDNIKRLFFRRDGYLYDETHNLLTQEFADTTLVNNVIEQIAAGESSVNVIADKIGESPSTVLYSLDKLISVGLVEKRHCITEEKNRKKTGYVLRDGMFKFWYAFVPKAASVIEMGKGDLYYEKAVKPNLHSFMGSIFEEMCRYYTLEQGIEGRFDNFLTKTGVWWGTELLKNEDGTSIRRSADIDIVGISDLDKTAVIGECKFKNEKIGKDVYDTLLRREKLLAGQYRVVKHLLFSLSGYTDWFTEASPKDLLRFTLKDLYQS